MRAPRVLGHIIDPESKARRLVILRELWLADVPRALIAERLHIDPQTVSWLARQAGLPMRHRRRKETSA